MKDELINRAGDAAATGIAVGSVLGWLPALAAVVSIVWFSIQIWESKTIQSFVQRWRERNARKDK